MDAVMSHENVVKVDQEYQQAIDALKEYMSESGKNQSQIGKELGLSSGLVSSFLGGKYTTPHTTIPKVMSYIEVNRKKKRQPQKLMWKGRGWQPILWPGRTVRAIQASCGWLRRHSGSGNGSQGM